MRLSNDDSSMHFLNDTPRDLDLAAKVVGLIN